MHFLTDQQKPIENYQSNQEIDHDQHFLQGKHTFSRILMLNVRRYKIDLDALKKACQILVNEYPLLRSTIYRQNELPCYFIKMEKEFDAFNNTELFNLSNSDSNWTDVIKRELKTPFDYQNGPMWRIKMLKLSSDNLNNEINEYALIMTQSHALGDGRCAYMICIKYLNILCDILENKYDEYKNIKQDENDFNMEELFRKHSIKVNSEKVELENPFTHVKLLENNFKAQNLNDNGDRFAYFQIGQIKLENILKNLKIKAPSAKFTGLLDVLICDAFNKAYTKHHPDQIPLEYIHFTHAVNVRSKLGVQDAQLGHFSRAIKLTMKVSELTDENLWTLSEKDSMSLHKKILDNLEFEGLLNKSNKNRFKK